MGFNSFSTGFVLGGLIAALLALLFARCPGSTGAANGKREGGRTISPERTIWSERQGKGA